MFDLKGKIALVTGSSRGLGLVLARGLGQHGARLILNGRNPENLERAVQALGKEGLEAHGYCFDVLDQAQIKDQVELIERDKGPIEILVNSAGVQKRGPLEEIEESVWREIIDTNLTGVFLVTQIVARGMIARKRGKIINICSLMSEVGRPTIAPYTAAKGGLKMLTKAMALEWAGHNIQVNGIGPGYFITEMTRVLAEDPKFDDWIKGRTPARRWGDPEELVGPVVFFASAASSFVTGQILYVDGGILATL